MDPNINWPALISALTFFLVAITAAINIHNQRAIAQVKANLTKIDGKLQQQMDTKVDKGGVAAEPVNGGTQAR